MLLLLVILLMQMQGTATLQGRQQETLQQFKRNLSELCLPKYILQMWWNELKKGFNCQNPA